MKSVFIKIIFIFLLSGLLVLTLKWNDLVASKQDSATRNESMDSISEGGKISAEHLYSEGLHQLTGKIILPTPCHNLEYTPTIRESSPEQVEVNFLIKPPQETDTVCAQVLEERESVVIFEASEEAIISAKINGEPTGFLWQ